MNDLSIKLGQELFFFTVESKGLLVSWPENSGPTIHRTLIMCQRLCFTYTSSLISNYPEGSCYLLTVSFHCWGNGGLVTPAHTQAAWPHSLCDLNKHVTFPLHTLQLLCTLAALSIIKAQGKRVYFLFLGIWAPSGLGLYALGGINTKPTI